MRIKLAAILTVVAGLALTGCSSSSSSSNEPAVSSTSSVSTGSAPDAAVFAHPNIEGLEIEFAKHVQKIEMVAVW